MAGIYLHIPFCKQACTYCNFHFSTSLRYKPDLVKALVKEAEKEKDYLQGEKINTIYFGGGTPSILEVSDLEFLISGLFKNYPVSADAEITLEANPDDITTDKLKAWKGIGINRLSIGIQSFFEEELKWMNRAHNAQQAIGNLQLARKEFGNITIDLIYGSPLLTDEMWKQNVDRAIAFEIPHLSCYALTVEEKTPLYKLINTEKTADVDNEKQARQFLLLMQWLREKGYEHYEVSNFAKPGFRSRHNSSYWKGEKYLGLGPSAHSYNGMERRWNVANNNLYIKGINENCPEREKETLTSAQKLNEFIMISLRTKEGMDLTGLEKEFGPKEKDRIKSKIEKFKNNNLICINNSFIQLTDEGMLRADGIASELFSN
ncbi:MAG: radical SAM family heme chaperone HemW [Flavisolibacter sp.]|nr:radical SAM family heme chaperone HemW [Flavisolibacter sp.]